MEAGMDPGLPERFQERPIGRRETILAAVVVVEYVRHLPDAQVLLGQGPDYLNQAHGNAALGRATEGEDLAVIGQQDKLL